MTTARDYVLLYMTDVYEDDMVEQASSGMQQSR